jgi:sulfur-carrier protein
MPKVVLACALARWLREPSAASTEMSVQAAGDTLGKVLECIFAVHPALRGYVLDDQGAVRHHLAIFIDGAAIHDKTRLQIPLRENAEIYIMQALSGG